MPLTLDQTSRIIATAALARSTEAGCRPMAVAVLDDAGHVKAVQRTETAASMHARGHRLPARPAQAAKSAGCSRACPQRAKNYLPAFFAQWRPVRRQVPQTGAVLIKQAEGQVISGRRQRHR